MKKTRHGIYLDDALTAELERLTRKPGASKSGVIAAGLKLLAERGAASEVDAVLRARLDRVTRDLSLVRRHQRGVLEILLMIVRWLIAALPPMSDAETPAARAAAEARFAQFLKQVTTRYTHDRRLATTLLEVFETEAEDLAPSKRTAR